MNKMLPERPDLGQLKKQAKDLLNDVRANRPEAVARVPQNELAGFALAGAQRVLAREYGFPSWAKLKLHVETREHVVATARFVAAVIKGDAAAMRALLEERPHLATETVSATAALADLAGLRRWVAQNPELARASGGLCQTEALGYVCLGRLGGDEAARVACADFLLQHGANPNAGWHDSDWPESGLPILYAATGRNNYPALARRLLAAGAQPNDGESIYHAAEHNHAECLEALLAAGADLGKRDEKWKNTPLYFLLGHSPRTQQAALARQGILWLLDHGADPNVTAYEKAEVPLHLAINNDWDLELITRLLDRGANPDARRADGKSAHLFAVCTGRDDVARLLRERGAADDTRPEHHFLGTCMRGQRDEARRLLAEHPAWRQQLTPAVDPMLLRLAKEDNAAAIALLAELGFGIDAKAAGGERPLHWAAWHGRAEAARTLVRAGADLNEPDGNYHAPPLGWCMHGSVNCRAVGGDYAAVTEVLLTAGARPLAAENTAGAPPEVAAVLARFAKPAG